MWSKTPSFWFQAITGRIISVILISCTILLTKRSSRRGYLAFSLSNIAYLILVTSPLIYHQAFICIPSSFHCFAFSLPKGARAAAHADRPSHVEPVARPVLATVGHHYIQHSLHSHQRLDGHQRWKTTWYEPQWLQEESQCRPWRPVLDSPWAAAKVQICCSSAEKSAKGNRFIVVTAQCYKIIRSGYPVGLGICW